MELKEIRRKITSVYNIWKLTSALETLSALKMKKAQKVALLSNPFAEKAVRLLAKVEPVLREKKSVFLRQRKVKQILIGILASDRGFCGSFNQNILRLAEKEIKEMEKEGDIKLFPMGKKAAAFLRKKGYKIDINFFGIGDFVTIEETKPISDFLIDNFQKNKFQRVYLVWTHFVSAFSQKPKITQLLPFAKDNFKEFLKEEINQDDRDFLVEPSLERLSREIIPQLVEYIIYQCVLDSNAAEHSSRMMAMRNASENAQKKAEELKLEHNKARQEEITSEVLEVSSAKEVLE